MRIIEVIVLSYDEWMALSEDEQHHATHNPRLDIHICWTQAEAERHRRRWQDEAVALKCAPVEGEA